MATAKADLVNGEKRMQNYSRDVEQMQSRLKSEFENLANRILEEKACKFIAQNQTNLELLLNPLRLQLGEFKLRIEQVYTSETADRTSLRTQIEALAKLNIQMTTEAQNLALTLKRDSKTQGNWGELILEKVLENSGLTPGIEFTVQPTLKGDDGSNLRPDVLIHLPDSRAVKEAKVDES